MVFRSFVPLGYLRSFDLLGVTARTMAVRFAIV